jgi:hypothetical protein
MGDRHGSRHLLHCCSENRATPCMVLSKTNVNPAATSFFRKTCAYLLRSHCKTRQLQSFYWFTIKNSIVMNEIMSQLKPVVSSTAVKKRNEDSLCEMFFWCTKKLLFTVVIKIYHDKRVPASVKPSSVSHSYKASHLVKSIQNHLVNCKSITLDTLRTFLYVYNGCSFKLKCDLCNTGVVKCLLVHCLAFYHVTCYSPLWNITLYSWKPRSVLRHQLE